MNIVSNNGFLLSSLFKFSLLTNSLNGYVWYLYASNKLFFIAKINSLHDKLESIFSLNAKVFTNIPTKLLVSALFLPTTGVPTTISSWDVYFESKM